MMMCSTCRTRAARLGQRTCPKCHRHYMRRWREGKVFVPRELVPHGTLNKASQRKAWGRLKLLQG
jgi:hypothetical protein